MKPPTYTGSTRKTTDAIGMLSTRQVMSFDQTSETIKHEYEPPRAINHTQAIRAYQETLNMPLQTRSSSQTMLHPAGMYTRDSAQFRSGPIETSNSDQRLTNQVSYQNTTDK